ncbi:hypothetical protein VTK56DRAFT_1799 [Thermocarpiscus australiensis]
MEIMLSRSGERKRLKTCLSGRKYGLIIGLLGLLRCTVLGSRSGFKSFRYRRLQSQAPRAWTPSYFGMVIMNSIANPDLPKRPGRASRQLPMSAVHQQITTLAIVFLLSAYRPPPTPRQRPVSSDVLWVFRGRHWSDGSLGASASRFLSAGGWG